VLATQPGRHKNISWYYFVSKDKMINDQFYKTH